MQRKYRKNFAPDLATVTHGIQLTVAPVFLLTAVSGMIGAVAGRLARIIDRARFLEDRLDASDVYCRFSGWRRSVFWLVWSAFCLRWCVS